MGRTFQESLQKALRGLRITSYNVCYTKLLREHQFEVLATNGEARESRRWCHRYPWIA